MTVGNVTFSKLQIILVVILLIGLIAGVVLTQRQKIFKSRAVNESIYNAFEIKTEDNKTIDCTNEANGANCKTDTLKVNLKLNDLNALTGSSQ